MSAKKAEDKSQDQGMGRGGGRGGKIKPNHAKRILGKPHQGVKGPSPRFCGD